MFKKDCTQCIKYRVRQDGIYKDHLAELIDAEEEFGIKILDRVEVNGEDLIVNLSKPYELVDCTDGVDLWDENGILLTDLAVDCEGYAAIALPENIITHDADAFAPFWLKLKAKWWLDECPWLKKVSA